MGESKILGFLGMYLMEASFFFFFKGLLSNFHESQGHLVPSEMEQKSFKIFQENATLTIDLIARVNYHAFLQRHCRRCDPGRALST